MNVHEYRDALVKTSDASGVVFPDAEYRQRLNRIKSRMQAEGLDGLIVTDRCNLFYITGYYTFGAGNHACLIIPLTGEPALHVVTLEVPAAVVNTWVKDIVVSDWQQQADSGEQLAAVVKEKGLENSRLGVEISRHGLLVSVYQALETHLPRAVFADASMLVDGITYVKSPLELDCMRKAGTYTVAAIEASHAATEPGVLDNDIARAGYDGMIAAGSEFMSVQPIVTSGVRSSFIHQTYRRTPIQENDIVFLEYSGCHHRYNAPLMRTIAVGKPSDQVMRIMEAVKNTLAAITEAARPGRSFHEVVTHAKKAHAGVDSEMYFFGSYGYGVGIGFPPTWGGSLHMMEGNEQNLLPGMTFHLPIIFCVPGKLSVALSETIVITDNGCDTIVKHPRELLHV